MKSSAWPWDGWLKPELPPPRLNVWHLKTSIAPPSCLLIFSFFSTCCSTFHDVKTKWESTSVCLLLLLLPPSPYTYRTFGHWTLNSFLVWELGECKHKQRGHKNKSVIARDSLCQHLSWCAPEGKRGHSQDYLLTKGSGIQGSYLMCTSPLHAPVN